MPSDQISLGGFPSPITTVDVVLFTVRDGQLHVLLPRRDRDPFNGARALVGGFIHLDEDADAGHAARRILNDKTGLADGYYLEQLATFSGPVRDPRGWSISIVYYAVVAPTSGLPQRDFIPISRLVPLPFDHDRIVRAALDRIRNKASYSTLPAFLLPPTFTMSDLHVVYEQVLGVRLDRTSFRRKIESQEFIEEVAGELRRGASYRPARLYRLRAGVLREFDRTI